MPRHPDWGEKEEHTYPTRPLNAITALTIHHTVGYSTPVNIAHFHVNTKGWPGIAYHFLIMANGYIYQTNHLYHKSYHAGSYNAPGDENYWSVGIALNGNFTTTAPPPAQQDAAQKLVAYLKATLPAVEKVIPHRYMPGASTACPGATWQQWLGYVAGEPVNPKQATVDVLPYIRGVHRRQFDLGYATGTQTTQVWHIDASNWLYIKGEQGDYERLGLRTWQGQEYIFRFEDTSESATRFYAHYLSQGGPIGAPWVPRHMEIGRWYETPKFVQHYLKAGCTTQNSDNVVDKVRLTAAPATRTYSQSGQVLPGVITLEWDRGEAYDFALDRGNVAFRDANRVFWFISDLQGRADKVYKKPSCINLGW